jgi:CheY-like chemotaxis protein
MALIPPRVLCVDDDEDSRVMLVTLLRHALIQAKAVGTAHQALSLIQSERFDLYLTDARLPRLDGFELCRRIRNFDRSTPILFFSGAADAADKRKGIEAGANGYVIKPDIEDLLRSIDEFIPLPGSPTPILREVSTTRLSAFSVREPLYVG